MCANSHHGKGSCANLCAKSAVAEEPPILVVEETSQNSKAARRSVKNTAEEVKFDLQPFQ